MKPNKTSLVSETGRCTKEEKKKGKNTVQSRKKVCEVYGEECFTKRQCQRRFARFRSGNLNVQDVPHTGRPTTTNDDKIKALIETNQRMTAREIVEKLDISNSIFNLHLQQLGYLDPFFASKNKCSSERGIFQLTEKWQKFIQQNDQYIID
ncbi:unnamed protein product [Euphydryas editha]|uniref:Mos1 transposase HTH domain-containing protein n=1 Tax=Euphydryas editha TaxID=104508 RepID=A0AAU9TZF3_EUPED|nr:unnamed protein product [Euphydryas editha]